MNTDQELRSNCIDQATRTAVVGEKAASIVERAKAYEEYIKGATT